MTSGDVWREHEAAIRQLASRALAARRVLTTSVKVPGGSLFLSASFAGTLDERIPQPPYLLEWLGPWDTVGRIWLDQGLERVAA